jgi:DNA-binding NarL/FixJ family response regulator
MHEKIDLVIVAKNLLYGECLNRALSEENEFAVAQVITDTNSAIDSVRVAQPDIALIDIDLADSLAFSLTRMISLQIPSVKLIMLGLENSEALILKCIEAGAHGYLLEESSFEDLLMVINGVRRGEAVCSPRVAYSIFTKVSELAHRGSDEQMLDLLNLTPREVEVFYLVADGLGNKQIAQRINLSIHTVKNHVHNIIEKLRVHNRLELMRYALSRGLMDVSRPR